MNRIGALSLILTSCVVLLMACGTKAPAGSAGSNPPAPGFNLAGSDAKAVALADEVMTALGGRKAWDETRYIRWNFFGRRSLLWDKTKGRVRIEMPDEKTTILLNIADQTGQVERMGVALTEPDSLKKYLEQGRRIWINDSYWLVMPYKMKDSGVTLKYLGEGKTEAGDPSDMLELTFTNVGVTPQNKYHIHVRKSDHLMTQWSFFGNYSDEKPRFTNPWANYQRCGAILLSGDRGGDRKLTDVAVFKKVPESAFTSLNALDLRLLQ